MSGLGPGILVVNLWTAVVLALPVCAILLWLYRRALDAAMRDVSGEPAPFGELPEPPPLPGLMPADTSRARRRLATVYVIAAFAAAIVWTVAWYADPRMSFNSIQAAATAYTLTWPLVPALATLLAASRRSSVKIGAAYVAAGIALVTLWPLVTRTESALGTVVVGNIAAFLSLLAIEVLPPAILIAVAANRRIRSVAPLGIAGLLVFTFGSFGVMALLVAALDIVSLRPFLLAGRGDIPYVLFMLATIPVGLIGWGLLGLLNRMYVARAFSDIQLTADTYWLIAAFFFSTQLTALGSWAPVAALSGFAAYRAVVYAGIRFWPLPAAQPSRLLVLRVFGYRRRTERLFDSALQQWRFRGPVRMIAGLDLATRIITPDATLAFLAGDFRSRFVRDGAELRQRLLHLADDPDPDGRCRVAPFFCFADTWFMTVTALLPRSDVIVMDLRGFDNTKRGCIDEIRALASQRRLSNTLFLHDKDGKSAAQQAFAEQVRLGLEGMPAAPELHVLSLAADSAADRARVYEALVKLASVPRVSAAQT